jgi:hypothetical protein
MEPLEIAEKLKERFPLDVLEITSFRDQVVKISWLYAVISLKIPTYKWISCLTYAEWTIRRERFVLR